MQILRVAIAVLVCFAISGCSDKPPADPVSGNSPAKISKTVVAVSYPLQFLTERIAGNSIEVILPFPADTPNPQTWRPSRESIGQMQAADLIIANGTGATYANWLTTVSLPESKIRNTASKGLSLSDYIAVEDVSIVHSHGPEGEHSHPTMVARTWLDPALAKKQANYIAKELTKTYPDHADEFAKNLEALNGDLDQLVEQIKSIKKNSSSAVITATPQLKFLTRAADVGTQHLTWFETPDVERAKSDLKQVLAGEAQVATWVLFDDTLPSAELVAVLKEHGLECLALGLIDRKPDQGDYLTAMQANIQKLLKALGN